MDSIERQIEILTHRITENNRLIENLTTFGISQRKIDRVVAKRDKYQEQLDSLLAEQS